MLKGFAWGACALSLVVLASGCAGGSKGPSDEELIQTILNDGNAALLAKDIPKATMSYSDDFTWDQGGKQEYIDFLTTAKDGGFLDDMTIDMSKSVTVIDGMMATAGPIVAAGTFGELTLNFTLEKRDGTWVITKQTQTM
jgi:hypothetical protein